MIGARFSLLGVNGEALDLSAPPFQLAGSPAVFGLGPVATPTFAAPALSAGSLRGRTRSSERLLTLPLVILAASQQVFMEAVETLGSALDPTRGDVVLQVERPDGTAREIVCHYSSGLTPAVAASTTSAARVDILFRCPHPFWRSTTPVGTAISFPVTGTGATATPFSDDTVPFSDDATPFDGWAATDEDGTVLVTLNNQGSAPAWPAWTVTGSATGVTATNLTTGRVWAWSVSPWSVLTPSETLEVRTAELSQSVRLASGENRYRGLSLSARDLWPLAPGANQILLQVTGADGTTTATIEYHPEWLTC